MIRAANAVGGFNPLPGSNPGASAPDQGPARAIQGGPCVSVWLPRPHGLQFGSQFSSFAPQSGSHTLTRVAHLGRGDVGVALGRHPRVADEEIPDRLNDNPHGWFIRTQRWDHHGPDAHSPSSTSASHVPGFQASEDIFPPTQRPE
jgi:hypothetical protein